MLFRGSNNTCSCLIPLWLHAFVNLRSLFIAIFQRRPSSCLQIAPVMTWLKSALKAFFACLQCKPKINPLVKPCLSFKFVKQFEFDREDNWQKLIFVGTKKITKICEISRFLHSTIRAADRHEGIYDALIILVDGWISVCPEIEPRGRWMRKSWEEDTQFVSHCHPMDV